MKLTNKNLKKLIEGVLNEQPPNQQTPVKSGGEKETEKKLKIDIPDSPFEPDVNQIKNQLKHILKQWEVKQYMSDKHRWQEYYRDIFKLVKHLDGDK